MNRGLIFWPKCMLHISLIWGRGGGGGGGDTSTVSTRMGKGDENRRGGGWGRGEGGGGEEGKGAVAYPEGLLGCSSAPLQLNNSQQRKH